MMSVTRFVIVVCMSGWSVWASAEESSECANFRCSFGDVPKANPPLIVEPFVSFYRDPVVQPMRPYHDWEPTARRVSGSSAKPERKQDLMESRDGERSVQ